MAKNCRTLGAATPGAGSDPNAGGGPVVTVDVEFACNTDTGLLERLETTITDGVAADPVITPTAVPCVAEPEPELDVETQLYCNPTTDTWWSLTINYSNSVEQSRTDVDTGMPCTDDTPDVQVDTEYVCNATTGFWDQHQTTTTNGVSAPAVITATTTRCSDLDLTGDLEIAKVCNTATGFYEIVAYHTPDGINLVRLSSTPTLERCNEEVKTIECVETRTITQVISPPEDSFATAHAVTATDSNGVEVTFTQAVHGTLPQQLSEWQAQLGGTVVGLGIEFTYCDGENHIEEVEVGDEECASITAVRGPITTLRRCVVAGSADAYEDPATGLTVAAPACAHPCGTFAMLDAIRVGPECQECSGDDAVGTGISRDTYGPGVHNIQAVTTYLESVTVVAIGGDSIVTDSFGNTSALHEGETFYAESAGDLPLGPISITVPPAGEVNVTTTEPQI